MKRTMSAALLLGLIASMASAATVESVNTTSTNEVNGWLMKGVAFSVVGDENSVMSLDEALDGIFSVGDKVYIFNGTDYNIYLYSANLFDPGLPGFIGPGWGNASGFAVDVSVAAGQAYWINTSASATYTTAGQVRESQFTINTVAGAFSMIANPYPAPTDLNDIAMTGVTVGDKVYLFNGTDYDIFVYSANLFDPTVPGFVGAGWGNASGFVADTSVPIAEGFWLETAAAVQVDFPTVL